MRLPKYRLFDYDREGPGVDKNAPKKTGIALFWDIFLRRFWKLTSLNLIYFLFSIPVLIIFFFALYAVFTLIFSEYMLRDETFAATVSQMAAYSSVFMLTLFGGGSASAGASFIVSNYVRDTHAWVWSDFFRIFKARFFKATAVFVVDFIMLMLIGINFWFYGSFAASNIVAYLLQGLMVVVLLILFLMHSYIYQIVAYYKDKKIFEIYKASFILAIGKLPQTALASFVTLAVSALVCYTACFITIYPMLLIPSILLTFAMYVNNFITNPVIVKYLGEIND